MSVKQVKYLIKITIKSFSRPRGEAGDQEKVMFCAALRCRSVFEEQNRAPPNAASCLKHNFGKMTFISRRLKSWLGISREDQGA